MIDAIPASAWAALTAVIGGVIGWITTRSRNKADAAGRLTESAMAFVNEMQEEIHRLQYRLEHVESDNHDKAERLRKVEAEIEDCEQRYGELLNRLNGNNG